MAEQGGDPEIPVEPEDPQTEIEEHVKFRRKQEVLNIIQTKLINDNLSEFRPIMNGQAYAFTALKIRNSGIKQLSDIIKQYEHLRVIDLSLNLLKDIPNLLNLKYVVKLDLSRNLISSLTFLSRQVVFPYLKDLNLQGNRVRSVPTIATKTLRRLNLNKNQIDNLEDFEGHPILQILELRGNKLKNLKGLKNIPSLIELYLAQNQLTSLKQVSNANRLIKLNARKNKIANLGDFPQLPALLYLNLRENQISKVNDLAGVGVSIKIINLLGNPIEAQLADNTKKQVWMKFRNFSKINKNQVTAQEREQFDKQYRDRLAEQEKQRLEKQAAERQAREQQQKQGDAS